MWLYLILFLIPAIAYFMGPAINRNKKFLVSYMVFLAFFVGMTDMFGGYDRYIYGEVFDGIADGVTHGLDYRSIYVLTYFEPLYSALGYLIALVTENRYVYILIVTLIIYFCIYKSFVENMQNYPLAMIIFLGMVFFFTFTYLRQVLAFAVAWLGVTYLIRGEKWKFFMIVVLVALLHKSGIIFATLYFVPIKKWKPQTVIITLLLCAIVGLTGVTGNLYDAYASLSNAENLNGYNTNDGARLAYILEVVFFTWIILNNYNVISSERKNLIFLNMAWLFCAILLLFIRSGDGGRVAWFFTLGIIYTISLISTHGTAHVKIKRGLGRFITVVMLLLYLRVYTGWQHYHYLYPYKTFLTNGHRNPDPLWERYEYDCNYDSDKFYRPAFRFLK